MYLPSAEVTERGDQEVTSENAVKYQVTLTAYPDSNGVKVNHFWSGAIAGATVLSAPAAASK